MALVKVTNNLLKDVHTAINRVRDKEIETTLPDLQKRYAIPNATELIERAEWLDHYDTLRPQIPVSWMEQRANDDIRLVNINAEDGVSNVIGQITFTNLDEHFKRPTPSAWERVTPQVTLSWLEAHQHLPGAAEAIQRYHDSETEKAIKARWEEVFSQLSSLLQRCKSVNEAVKLVPNLKIYLGYDVIERLERKVERATRESTVLEGIDVEAINVAGVAAKLQGHF